ncbi:MAG: VWA domain-containing protein [Nitriliruptoraceae bacterium]
MADPDPFTRRVLDFHAALRRAGVVATQSEAIDAMRVLEHINLADRRQLHAAFAAVVTTSAGQRRVFDDLFDLYFPALPATERDTSSDENDTVEVGAFLDELRDALARGDAADRQRLARQAVSAFGRVDGRDGTASYFQYRVFRAIDLARLLEQLVEEHASDDRWDEQLLRAEFDARINAFRTDVERDVRQRAAAQRGIDQVAERAVGAPIEDRDFFQLTPREQREVREHIRPLARKLASRVAVKRRHGRHGRLDVRRTVRRSLSTGGIPFDPTFRPRRPHKPELFVLCDVSGSVASFARFTLMLVHALQEQFSKVRSFAFIDNLDEVTATFDHRDIDEAFRTMLSQADLVWFDGHSDYGHALERFWTVYGRDVTPKTTVLILGDARNNYRQANAWVLKELASAARHVYWLNPESAAFWDSGDSIASSYARHVDDMVEVRNLRQLGRFVEQLV